MGTQQTSFSVLMFPWLAHGHISPFLELAKKLSERNIFVYLCSTPINLVSIKNRITKKYVHSIEVVELHLPSLPELPPHYHTTNGLPTHLMPTLRKVFDMASPHFAKILETLKPNLLIYDCLQPWAAEAALACNIPAIQFVSGSASTASYYNLLISYPDVEYPFSHVYLRGFELDKIRGMLKSSKSGGEEKNHAHKSIFGPHNMMLIKTFNEIEAKYIDYLSVLIKKKIVPVGPLVQEHVEGDRDEDLEIIKWLSKKDQFSTVFVSFGSEYFLSKEDVEEIAHGLALSNVNFIWVFRSPMGEKTKVEEALPEGFLEKVIERGMVVEGWAPQAKILGHSSVGGFVSHCGWNSVLESMKFGVPIIAIPMQLDQPLNARLMVEVGGAMEVMRDEDGRLQREVVAKVIREVVVEKNGEEVRKKARELSENMRLRGDEEIDIAVEELVKFCEECKEQ